MSTFLSDSKKRFSKVSTFFTSINVKVYKLTNEYMYKKRSKTKFFSLKSLKTYPNLQKFMMIVHKVQV